MTYLLKLLDEVNGSKIYDCPDIKTFVRNASSHGIQIFNSRKAGYNRRYLAMIGLRMHLQKNTYTDKEFAVMELGDRFFIYWRSKTFKDGWITAKVD